VQEHNNWNELLNLLPGYRNMYALSTKGSKTIWQANFRLGDVLVFGPETRGLPDSMLAGLESLKIPMRSHAQARSLNLSTACGIAVYEALRQIQWQP